MKNRLIPMLMLMLAMTLAAKANPVDMRTVREVALKFVNANAKVPLRGTEDLQLVTTFRTESNDAAFHIFNTPNGFVIVSADDCATPILGYSDEGRPFDLENIPIQLQELFNGYLKQFQYGFDNHLEATETVTRQWRQVKAKGRLSNNRDDDFVEPLLTTQWNQDWPFNAMCPIDENGDRCLVGCVAVALGQIMKYHNWPPKGYGHVHYTLPNMPDTISAVFDTTHYDWSSMPEGWTDSGYESMAQLLADIGKALFTEYSSGSSGAFSNAQTLADVFNYDYFSIREVQRDHVDDSTWMSIIKNELSNGRPVDYTGYSNEDPSIATGHEFVCDGYDQNDMFHFNFGWGGSADGYYLLSNIYVVLYNFNYYQSILTGIQPAENGSTISGNETLSGNLEFDHSLYCGAFSNVTVAPGTQLRFAPGKGMCATGSFLADGTEENPILITAIDTILGWEGLQIHPSMICYKMVEEPDTLSLNYTTISYASNDGIHLEWPNYYLYPATPDNVIHKGLILNHSKIAHNKGNGIAGEQVLLTIDSCEFSGNGGLCLSFNIGAFELTRSELSNNNGCIWFHNQSELFDRPTRIIDNRISSNNTERHIVEVDFSSTEESMISGNEFYENITSGAVVWCNWGGSVIGNRIHDNISNFYYGGIILYGTIFKGNKLWNNQGWAIACENGGVINGNLIYNNTGGFYSGTGWGGDPFTRLYNNTIVNNTNSILCGEYLYAGTFDFRNNILWNSGLEICARNDSKVLAYNNIIKGGSPNIAWENPNTIMEFTCDKEPKFINPTTFIGPGEMPENVDFSLDIASPAIDNAYYDTTMVLPNFDLNGNPRINRILDIGAVENQSDVIHPCFYTEATFVKSCVGLSLDISFPYRGEDCSFEWFRDNAIVPNTTSDTLHIEEVSFEDSSDYYCVISNSIGVDTSSVIHVGLSPQLPVCIDTIFGTDTIHHFQKEIPFSVNNVAYADLIEWMVSDGLSYTKTSDTSILVSVHEAVNNAFLYVVASNGCGACADTARIDFTILPVPSQLYFSGNNHLIANSNCGTTITAETLFYYDSFEWQIPSWLNGETYLNNHYVFSTSDYHQDTDTIYARWVIDEYGTGDWTPYPIYVYHPENYGDIVYVTTQGGGREDGSSWTNAISDLSIGINIAACLEKKLWVASGTYYGDGKSDNAFPLPNVEIYGGLTGVEDDSFNMNDRNLIQNATILDGQNVQRVFDWGNDFVIDGITIQNGGGNFVGAFSFSEGIIRNCIIRNNSLPYVLYSLGVTVQNSLFYNNVLPFYEWNVINSTFVNNIGNISFSNVYNSIIIDSCSNNYYAIRSSNDGDEGIITLANENDGNDPDANYVRFVDPENGDFRLSCGSACINMGIPDISELGLPEVDLQGNPRVMDGRIDMGAYEFDPSGYINHTIVASVNPEGTGSVTGGGEYMCGQICTLTATPKAGYAFVNWTKDNEGVSSEATYSFTVTESATYVANFSLDAFHFTTPGTWSTPTNWQGGALPDANDIVFIDAPCQLDQNAEVTELTVSDGQSLTLQSGMMLTVTGNLNNTATTGLVIEDGAQLVHNVANVQAKVKKFISPFNGTDDGWHLIAIPLTGSIEVESVGHLLEGEYDLYGYDESTVYWMNSKHPGDGITALEAAKGYLYANGAEVTLEFSGNLQNSTTSVTVPLSYTDGADFSGFNLVGNPFPCNAYIDREYYVLNTNGSDINPVAVSSTTPIPPCAAVFVKAEAVGDRVVFTREMQ